MSLNSPDTKIIDIIKTLFGTQAILTQNFPTEIYA